MLKKVDKPRSVGRKRLFPKEDTWLMIVRQHKATQERIDAVLRRDEDISIFVRRAVERELRRREKMKGPRH